MTTHQISMQKYHGESCHEIHAQTVSLFITSYLRSESLISSATLDRAGEGAAHKHTKMVESACTGSGEVGERIRVRT